MGGDDDVGCGWLNHPLWNFQRGSAWRSNYDPLTAPNRVVDDLQFLSRIGVKSIVNRNSGTIGILKCCCSTSISMSSASTAFTRQASTDSRSSSPYGLQKTVKSGSLRHSWPSAFPLC